MPKLNCLRPSCKDVFNAFLVSTAAYAGIFEFPIIQPAYWIPNRLISFSKAISCKDFNQWVHFYQDDYLIERFWRNPKRYLKILQRYNGVILPDYSLYRDMPFVMQIWNIYRSRALGFWMQSNGIKVIANVRFSDSRTALYCCSGISTGSIIAIGTLGTLDDAEDRLFFCEGLEVVVKILEPSAIIIYGSAPSDIFDAYRNQGIAIIPFESETFVAHHQEVE